MIYVSQVEKERSWFCERKPRIRAFLGMTTWEWVYPRHMKIWRYAKVCRWSWKSATNANIICETEGQIKQYFSLKNHISLII